MATIPVYEPRQLYQRKEVGPTRGSRAVLAEAPELSFWKATYDFGQSTQRLGLVLQDNKNRIDDERDKMAALNASTRYGTWNAEYLQDKLSLRGREAVDLVPQAVEDQGKIIQEISDTLDNDKQRAIFTSLTAARRTSGQMSVAKHEANEHQALKAQEAKAALIDSERHVRMHADNQNQVEEEIGRVTASFDVMFKDQNEPKFHAAARQQIEDSLLTAQIDSLVAKNPARGLDLIEQDKYKAALGENFPRLKAQLTKKADEVDTTEAYNLTKARFGRDLNGAIEWLGKPSTMKELGLKVGQMNTVREILEGEKSYRDREQARIKTEGANAEAEAFYGILNNPQNNTRVADAVRFLDNTQHLDPDSVQSMRVAIQANEWKTSPAVLADTTQKIRAHKITQPSQVPPPGAGLSQVDYNKSLDLIEEVREQYGQVNFFDESMKKFDAKAGTDEALKVKRPDYMAALNYLMKRDNLVQSDPAVNEIADKLFEEMAINWMAHVPTLGLDLGQAPLYEVIADRQPWLEDATIEELTEWYGVLLEASPDEVRTLRQFYIDNPTVPETRANTKEALRQMRTRRGE